MARHPGYVPSLVECAYIAPRCIAGLGQFSDVLHQRTYTVGLGRFKNIAVTHTPMRMAGIAKNSLP